MTACTRYHMHCHRKILPGTCETGPEQRVRIKKNGKKNVTVVHGTIVTDWREQTVNSPCVRDAYQAVGDGSKEDYHSWK